MAAASRSGIAVSRGVRKFSSHGQHAALFDAQAAAYVKYRPVYPEEVHRIIASYHQRGSLPTAELPAVDAEFAPRPMHHAVDIAAGSGQASVPLTRWFDNITAIDASAEQVAAGQAKLDAERPALAAAAADGAALKWGEDARSARLGSTAGGSAPLHPSVLTDPLAEPKNTLLAPGTTLTFSQGTSEATGQADASADLVIVAQAMHWFDIPAFFAEAHRILKPGGTLAVLGYGFPIISSSAAGDDALRAFDDSLAPDWSVAQRALVVDLYRGLDPPGTPAPGCEVPLPADVPPGADYRTHPLPTHPPRSDSMEALLADLAGVQPRRFEGVVGAEFDRVTRGTLTLDVDMPVEGVVGYLSTWSGYNTALKRLGICHGEAGDPLQPLREALVTAVGGAEAAAAPGAVTVSWPCALSLAKKPEEGL